MGNHFQPTYILDILGKKEVYDSEYITIPEDNWENV